MLTHLSADCNEQTLGGSQLQLLLIEKQAQRLHEFTVLSSDVVQRHPVNVARESVQRCDADSAVGLSLCETTVDYQVLTTKASVKLLLPSSEIKVIYQKNYVSVLITDRSPNIFPEMQSSLSTLNPVE